MRRLGTFFPEGNLPVGIEPPARVNSSPEPSQEAPRGDAIPIQISSAESIGLRYLTLILNAAMANGYRGIRDLAAEGIQAIDAARLAE